MTPERIQQLAWILWDTIDHIEDIKAFVQMYVDELDDDFFTGLYQIVRNAETGGYENHIQFFTWILQTLYEIVLPSNPFVFHQNPDEGLPSKADILAEDEAITALIALDPDSAYNRALLNLQHAQYTASYKLIMECAFTLGQVANNMKPFPKFQETIYAYQIASHHALLINDDYAYAAIQNNLGTIYFNRPTGDQEHNYRCAILAYRNALQIYTLTDFPEDYAFTQNNLGTTYWSIQTGDRVSHLHMAINAYQNALQVYTEKKYPEDYAVTQINLGVAYADLVGIGHREYLQAAITAYQNALQIHTRGKYPDKYAKIHNNIGALLHQEGQYINFSDNYRQECLQQAIRAYQIALKIYTKDEFPSDYAMVQNNLGLAYYYLPLGNREAHLQSAIEAYLNTLEIITAQEFPREYALTQNSMGLAYSELTEEEELSKAILAYREALRIYNEKEFPRQRIQTLINLTCAYTSESLHDWLSAYHTCEEAIRVLETKIRVTSSTTSRRQIAAQYASLYSLMVSLCMRLQLIEDAIDYAERGKSRTLLEMIVTAQRQPSEDVPSDVRQMFIIVQSKLEELYYRQQKGEYKILRDFEIFGDGEKSIQLRAISVTNPSLKEEIQTLIEELQQIRNSLLMDAICKYDPKFVLTEPIKSVSLTEITASIPEGTLLVECFTGDDGTYLFGIDSNMPVCESTILLKEMTSSEVERIIRNEWYVPYYAERHIQNMLHVLKLYLSTASTPTDSAQHIDSIKQRILEMIHIIHNDFTDWCARLDLDISSFLYELTEYLEDENIGDISDLLSTFNSQTLFTQLRQGWYTAINRITEWLSDHFWYAGDEQGNSLASLIDQRGIKRIVFIPHGGLHLLPLHLLPLRHNSTPSLTKKQGKAILLNTYEIIYAPSLSLMDFALNQQKDNLIHLVALANPDNTLLFADGEIHEISRHFAQKTILWHEQASKNALLKAIENANILHCSCHCSFHLAEPLMSQLFLRTGPTATFPLEKYNDFLSLFPHAEQILGDVIITTENDVSFPLALLSEQKKQHLQKDACAMIEHYARESLTLQEIFASVRLSAVSMVVLSACETGMIQLEHSDEYIGLPGGFLYAGTPTVISSLWAVDDLSTSLLMNRLYENMIPNKMGKAAALREAQLWVRDLTYKELVEYLEDAPLGQHIDYTMLRGIQRSAKHNPDKKPFEHPYYWGAFTCNGSWK